MIIKSWGEQWSKVQVAAVNSSAKESGVMIWIIGVNSTRKTFDF